MPQKYNLFDKNTQSFIYGMKIKAIQRMLDFDYICKREKPSVTAVINPGKDGLIKAFWVNKEIMIPVFKTIEEASKNFTEVDVLINFASMRSAYKSTLEAFEANRIRVVAIIAEGIPERRSRELIALAKEKNKILIGPATVGGLKAGAFKIGNTGGTIENIISSKLHRPGSVGFVAKSGGMSNEMFNVIANNANGVNEGIAIGGDRYPGSSLLDHLLRYEKNPDIKMMVCLGEVGGNEEYAICQAIKDKKITKPLVAWVTGTCAKAFPSDVQFGHAGAKANVEAETADAKNEAFKKAGAFVPNSFNDIGKEINKLYKKLLKKGEIKEITEPQIPELAKDYAILQKQGQVRKSTNFLCTISDDRGEEATYVDIPISSAVNKMTLGDTISLLWFRKKLPDYGSTFLEMVLKTVADHGPCVSGAHNAIVTARAGKDLVSSLASGLLTIGPRFGGAIDGAAYYFKYAIDSNLSPLEFVKEMKSKNINIPGIGHKIKSTKNPDKRVETLKSFAQKNFKKTDLLDYALEVEKITTSKKDNLILNVDGCIGILFVDLFSSCGKFKKEEVEDIVNNGALNGLFVLGRSIGLIGHILDQKRNKQGLYRHPWDDVCYDI